MIVRLIWLLCILVIGAVTAAVQLDRQADISPGVAPIVPAPFRGHAQARIVTAALAEKTPSHAAIVAVPEAERLVRRRPIPAEHLTLLAIARAKAGETEASSLTIQYAAQRGWREPIAQETMLRLAVAAGDRAEAARRYAALFLRDATPDALLEEFGPRVLSTNGNAASRSEGLDTMIAIVSGSERWQSHFLRRGARVMPPAAFSTIVSATSAKGVRYDCDLMQKVGRAVSARDEAAGGSFAGLIVEQCPKSGGRRR